MCLTILSNRIFCFKFAQNCLTKMSNINKEQTEELIKETAKKLFFVDGKFGATTQEIADEAGVNRTLINYYFRSRDNLVEIIFKEAKEVELKKSQIIENENLNVKEKIEKFIEKSLETGLKYPYLETYIVSQMNKGECPRHDEIDKEHMEKLFKDLEMEMEKGNITKMPPVQFALNLVSLLVFPIAMRPLLCENLGIAEKDYDKILTDRKEIIMKLLFKN